MNENFLILNLEEDRVEASAFRTDFAKREITFLSKEILNANSWSGFKNALGRAFYPYSYKIILSLDSGRCFGIRQAISCLRDEPEKSMDAAELQNIVSQIVLKFFEENRRAGVKQLKLSEADLLLFDTRVYDFKAGGSRVIDPFGHRGEEIEIDLAQTFLNRNFYQSILSILPKRARLAWIAGAGIAASQTLSRMSPRKKFIFAKVLDNRTDLFLARPEKARKIVFWDCFKWGKRKFYGALGKNMKVESSTAELLVKKYLAHETSRIFGRNFKQIIKGELITLIRGLRHAKEEAEADFVYLDGSALFTINPFGGQREGLRSRQLFPKMVKLTDAAETAIALGFKLKNKDWAPDILSLAFLVEFYFLPQEDLINRLAKRRMRWLTA